MTEKRTKEKNERSTVPKPKINQQVKMFEQSESRERSEPNVRRRSEKTPAWNKLNAKNDVVGWERNNYDKIVFYSTGKEFWQATQHSCLFMVNVCHDLLGLGSKVKSVYDFYINTDRIYTAYHLDQMRRIKVELVRLGMKLLRESDTILIFEMLKPIEPKMLGEWAAVEDIRRKKLEAYLMPNTGSTELYAKIRELGRDTILATNRMNEPGRFFALKLLGYLENLYDLHLSFDEKNKAAMLETLGRFSYFVQIMNDEKLIEDRKAHKVGMTLHAIRKELCVGHKARAVNQQNSARQAERPKPRASRS